MNRGSRVKAFLVGAVALVVLAGCSSGKDTYTPPPTQPTDSGPSSASTAVPVPRKELLGLADLPTGWTVDNKPDDAQKLLPPCYKSAMSTKDAKASASAGFLAGGTSPFLIESIGYYTGTAAAAKLASASKTLGHCRDLSYVVKKVKITGTVSATSFPGLGDESRAYTATLSLGGAPVTLYLVVLRSKTQVVSMCYGVVGTGSILVLQQLANTAVNNLSTK
jgi:hypothetical protein